MNWFSLPVSLGVAIWHRLYPHRHPNLGGTLLSKVELVSGVHGAECTSEIQPSGSQPLATFC